MRKKFKITMFILSGLLFCVQGYPGGQDGFKKSPTGLVYKIFKVSKDTARPAIGDWITIEMRYSTMIHGKDSLLFDSKTQMKGEPVKISLPSPDFRGDLYEGIGMLSPGDSGIFIINSDSLFLKTFRQPKRPAMIDSNASVSFYVHLVSSENPAQMREKEEAGLKKFLADNKITVAPTPSGVYIVESQAGEGLKIDTGSMVTLQFIVSLINGEKIFSSYDRPEPLKFQCGTKFDTPGMQEAVEKMKKGEKAKVIVPSHMGFGEKGRGSLVPPYATLVYDVEILDVVSKEDVEKEKAAEKLKSEEKNMAAKQNEAALIAKYLKEKNITVKPTASGLYYVEKVKGTGPQAVAGHNVRVHYSGTLLDGTPFDSSVGKEPLEFPLGAGRVIEGWDEGIAMMKQGGKAMLVVPSSIGYGEHSMGAIQPFSTLVFEVELIEVK
jgi:FKBP-type peptidyl-prolyl cis-trans isomerase